MSIDQDTISRADPQPGTRFCLEALRTGMVPETLSEEAKSAMLDPSIMVPPLLWLVSPEADEVTGRRMVATKWQTGSDGTSAAEAATEQAGW
jgi:hypothetical protein